MSDQARPADTPEPPYHAVIFTSLRTKAEDGYGEMSALMEACARAQPGFLGMEAARDGLGITVSYWRDAEAILAWKRHLDHLGAQRLGRQRWYASYRVRVAKVERAYGFDTAE